MNIKNKKINFLGDSITEGHGTNGSENIFTSIIAEKYGAVCRNYGIGGTRIARQLNLSDNEPLDKTNYCARVDEMDADADIIVVFGGTNDFGHGNASLGIMSDRENSTFYGALHTLFTKLITKYPKALIVVLTPTHRTNEDSPRGDNKPEDVGTLLDYVRIIRQVSEYYSLPVLDLFAVSGMQPKVDVIKEKYIPDGLHPNNAGHKIIADKIAHFLQTL